MKLTKQQIDYPPQVPGLRTLGVICSHYAQWIWWRRANSEIPNTKLIIFPRCAWGLEFRGLGYIDTRYFNSEQLENIRKQIK